MRLSHTLHKQGGLSCAEPFQSIPRFGVQRGADRISSSSAEEALRKIDVLMLAKFQKELKSISSISTARLLIKIDATQILSPGI